MASVVIDRSWKVTLFDFDLHNFRSNQMSKFLFRYQILAPTAVAGGFMDGKKACEKLLDAMQLEKASYRVGTSKVMHTDL